MSLIPSTGDVMGPTIQDLPNLLKQWIKIQDEVSAFNAEIKERRTQSKALREMILRIMDSNRVVQLNVSKGSVVHRTREIRQSMTNDYVLKHCKDFFNGDEGRAQALVDYLNETRIPTLTYKMWLKSAGGSPTATRQFLVTTVTLIIILGALLFAGKFLWNNVLSVLVPAIKPAKSVWQILGLALLISLMHPGCSCTVY